MAIEAQTRNPPAEVEFQMRDADCFFIEASERVEGRVSLEHLINRSDGRLLEYFTIEEASAERVLSMVDQAPGIDDARLVSRGMGGTLFEFVVSGPCVTTTLADTGAVTQSVSAENGVGHVVASIPSHVPVRQVVETFCDRYAETDLVARQNGGRNVPIRTAQGERVALTGQLTEKQLEVLRVAYRNGYFAWPRQSTAADCADALGISQPTFSQHIRVAQEKLFSGLFEAAEARQTADPALFTPK